MDMQNIKWTFGLTYRLNCINVLMLYHILNHVNSCRITFYTCIISYSKRETKKIYKIEPCTCRIVFGNLGWSTRWTASRPHLTHIFLTISAHVLNQPQTLSRILFMPHTIFTQITCGVQGIEANMNRHTWLICSSGAAINWVFHQHYWSTSLRSCFLLEFSFAPYFLSILLSYLKGCEIL